MALLNYSSKEVNAKIVYYGPGLCGKTTNLDFIYKKLRPGQKGKLVSLATQTDRTLFFDFLPVELGEIKGFKTRFHLYTVPGQVFYNATRKMVLKGADGVIFVADSQRQMMDANMESLRNLEENLRAYGKSLEKMPHAIQFNKRDLPNVVPLEEMYKKLNKYNAPFVEAAAINGKGVMETLSTMSKMVLRNLRDKAEEIPTVTSDLEESEVAEEAGISVSEAKTGVVSPASAASPELEIAEGLKLSAGTASISGNTLTIPLTIRSSDVDREFSIKVSIEVEELVKRASAGISAETDLPEVETVETPVITEEMEEDRIVANWLKEEKGAPKSSQDEFIIEIEDGEIK